MKNLLPQRLKSTFFRKCFSSIRQPIWDCRSFQFFLKRLPLRQTVMWLRFILLIARFFVLQPTTLWKKITTKYLGKSEILVNLHGFRMAIILYICRMTGQKFCNKYQSTTIFVYPKLNSICRNLTICLPDPRVKIQSHSTLAKNSFKMWLSHSGPEN